MVHLTPGKTIFDEKTDPLTRAWDLNMREHYAFYEDHIHQQLYRLQKGLKGFGFTGEWSFPYRYQHRYLLLELYQKKQYLGKVNQEEVDRYNKSKATMGCIKRDLMYVYHPLR
jgi:hypothetical protein